MTNNNSRVVLLLILSFLGNFGSIQCRDSEGNHLKKECEAPVATEGDTGVMTFFLRDSIDLVSDKVFVSLKRATKPEEVLAACSKFSPIKCESQNQRYQISTRIVNHQLTLRIPNITAAFEDIYVVHVYVNDAPEPADTCHLTVHGKNSRRFCSAPTVKEGDTGVMTFFFHEDVVSSSNHLTAKLAHDDRLREIISCHRKVEQSNFTCDVKDKLFTVDGEVQHSLTMRVPSITGNLRGHYILEVMDNNRHLHHESCYLDVEVLYTTPNPNVPVNTQSGNQIADYVWIAIAFALLLVVMIACLGVIVFRQASCRQRKEPQVDGHDENTTPLLETRSGRADENEMALLSIATDSTVDNYEGKRWYWADANKEVDILLVKNFWKNGPGAFLVRPSTINSPNFVLVASFDGTVKHLTLIKTTKGVTCPSTEASFETLCQVVQHYKKKPIIFEGRLWGTLSKPCGRAPEENWYYGRLAVEYENDVLLPSERESGSFLVADASTDTDAYYLIVNIQRRIHRFGIAPNDVGFRMVDTDLLRNTLTELVDYYKHNDIVTTAGKNLGKLSKPCPKEPYVHWFSETLTIDEEMKILQSRRKRPGSFLVSTDDNLPNKYVLAVYFADEIKRFTVTEESNRFKLRYGEMLFYSWYELVDYYREHDIEIRGNSFGKLSTPLRKEPEESCYIGRKTRMEERDLLLAGTAASGDFLIRDGITDPEAYVLAVNFRGHINHFDIYRENGGFRFCDTGKLFTTLGELVDFYKNIEITVDELTFGKLVKKV